MFRKMNIYELVLMEKYQALVQVTTDKLNSIKAGEILFTSIDGKYTRLVKVEDNIFISTDEEKTRIFSLLEVATAVLKNNYV